MLNNRTVTVILLFTWTITSFSCKKFLDVQPRDFIFERELFSKPDGVHAALNGIYQSLGSQELYGKDLTLYAVDLMGQMYEGHGVHSSRFRDLVMFYDYTKPIVKQEFSAIWTSAFKTILNVNNFCAQLEQPSFSTVSEVEKNSLLGEAYAIRGMLYLDLLRLFGPAPGAGNNKPCIPYVTAIDFKTQPLLPGTQIMDSVMKDLSKAATLLKADLALSDVSLDSRKWRLNYFAVKALQARANLYAGKNEAAWQIVLDIQDRTNQVFPWMASADAAKADPVFFGESLFGAENKTLYDTYRQLFNPLLSDDSIMAPTIAKFNSLYDNPNDYRQASWFKPGTSGNKNYNVFIKYSDEVVTSTGHSFFQPLIRKAELILIGAEAAPDLTTGYRLLNTLRLNRGLQPIDQQDSRSRLLSDILQEYQREFWGEGQLFFLFKRRNLSTIPDAATNAFSVSMDPAKYQVPIPEQETLYR